MNTTKNRMGGFIAAEVIRVEDIQSFQVQNNKVRLVYKDNYIPTFLDIVKNGVEASASCTTTKSGKIYNIDITVETKNADLVRFTSFNKYLSILTTTTGERHVFGSPQFPLTITVESIYSKTPSGATGRLYKMTGKQPNNVLIM